MKGNNGTGNCIDRDEWETPKLLFDVLNKQYSFTFDCCATYENKKAKYWFDKNFLDVIKLDLFSTDVCWMNPPFSKAFEMFRHFFKIIPKGVCIYRCDNMETKVWQDIILKNATWIFIPKGRICYEGMQGKGSRFPSALIGFNVDIPKGLNGVVLEIKQREQDNGR